MDSFKYFLTKLMCRSLTPRLVSQVQFQKSGVGFFVVFCWGLGASFVCLVLFFYLFSHFYI